ncbi:hypothetical protein B0H16DRAFT_1449717 [Mycena metata]|uniref:Uncharacterized protein n=1 Tax=Mycena metata TaxID=1033252 RepID=A0AAD7K1J5_9AGAR|nr:hypothetical protein B0H16DRAFT_1449717 [Mycena metata]
MSAVSTLCCSEFLQDPPILRRYSHRRKESSMLLLMSFPAVFGFTPLQDLDACEAWRSKRCYVQYIDGHNSSTIDYRREPALPRSTDGLSFDVPPIPVDMGCTECDTSRKRG